MPSPLKSPLSQRLLFSTLFVLNCTVIFGLVISNYLYRDNNYGIRADQYSIRTIGADEFERMAPDRQIYWSRASGSKTYVGITITNSFVSSHKNIQVLPVLPLSVVALILCGIAFRSPRRAEPGAAADGDG